MRMIVAIAMMTGATMWAQGQAQTQKVDPAAAAKAGLEKAQAEAKPAGAEKPAAAEAAPKVSLLAMPPEAVVATVDGQKVTAGALQVILRSLPPQAQQQALSQTREFVAQYGVLNMLTHAAEQDKLDQQSPWREAIAYGRMQVLYQAAFNKKIETIKITPEDAQKFYDSNKDRFVQAKVKGIYIPFSAAPVSTADGKGQKVLSEAEAKAKIEGLVKQARGGADFGKLAKENSGDATSAAKDGDFGVIAKNAPGLPEAVKTAIFGAKAGQVTDPVRQPNGFYIFRVGEIGQQPLDEVRENIENELKNARLTEWMNSLQKSLDIKMEGQFSESPSPAPSPKPAPAK